MTNQSDIRRIAMSLPGTSAAKDRFAFSVRNGDKEKAFVWVWLERTGSLPSWFDCRQSGSTS